MVERSLIAAALLAIACRPTTSIGSTAGETTSTSDVSTSSGDATSHGTSTPMDATTQIGMDGSSSSSTGGDGSIGPEGSGPDTNDPDTSDPDTGDGPMCMPAQFDSQCIACAKVHCCAEFGACASDFDCGCTLGCLQYPGFPGPCMCAPTQQGADLFACLESECDFVCPPVG